MQVLRLSNHSLTLVQTYFLHIVCANAFACRAPLVQVSVDQVLWTVDVVGWVATRVLLGRGRWAVRHHYPPLPPCPPRARTQVAFKGIS
jgi:hypothetical protein